MYKYLLIAFFALTVFSIFAMKQHVSVAQSKPNIVFMLADDCTSWDIGVYGNKDSKTPTIDQLASEGMQFMKCYQSSPMCSPTRQNILTGLSPFRSGAYPNHTIVNDNVKSIAHYLTPLGYRVALSGKQHYGPDQNFPLEYLGKSGKDLDPDFNNIDKFLKNVSSDNQPFCLFVCSNQPHSPWNRGDTTLFNKAALKLPPYFPDLPRTRENFRNYLAEINYLDGQVKQALDLLEKYHLSENTIFVFASEQGTSLPFAKWTCYNAGLRSALIVRWPGKVKPNTVSNALVEYSDFTPTFIDIAGGKPVKDLDGSSLVPVLTGKRSGHKNYTYGQMTTRGIYDGSDYYPIRSVSNGKYRYIVNLTPDVQFRNTNNKTPFFRQWEQDAITNPKTKALVNKHNFRPAEELYDDEADPFNQQNLINEPGMAVIRAKLKNQLKAWMKHTGDKGLLTELIALEHMPTRKSGYPVIIDTTLHKPVISEGGNTINVPVDGYYTFNLAGKGQLKVDNIIVVQANGSADDKVERYGVLGLAKGTHSVQVMNAHESMVSYSGPVTPLTTLNGSKVSPPKAESEN